MKIPETIRIAGIDYDVQLTQGVRDGATALAGQIRHTDSTILLEASCGHQYLCQVLWHEILHGIVTAADLSLEDEEHVVDVLAHGVYQVLQDNGRKLFDIAE